MNANMTKQQSYGFDRPARTHHKTRRRRRVEAGEGEIGREQIIWNGVPTDHYILRIPSRTGLFVLEVAGQRYGMGSEDRSQILSDSTISLQHIAVQAKPCDT